MQKSQPHFTSDQRRELVEEHPWMRRGGLPAAINVKVSITRTDADQPCSSRAQTERGVFFLRSVCTVKM